MGFGTQDSLAVGSVGLGYLKRPYRSPLGLRAEDWLRISDVCRPPDGPVRLR